MRMHKVFAFLYSVGLSGCFFSWRGRRGDLGAPFFFIREGPLAPFHKILAATPYNASSDRSTCLEDVFISIAQQCASLLLCSFPVICVGVGLTILNSVCWCGCVHSQHHGSVRMRLFWTLCVTVGMVCFFFSTIWFSVYGYVLWVTVGMVCFFLNNMVQCILLRFVGP